MLFQVIPSQPPAGKRCVVQYEMASPFLNAFESVNNIPQSLPGAPCAISLHKGSGVKLPTTVPGAYYIYCD